MFGLCQDKNDPCWLRLGHLPSGESAFRIETTGAGEGLKKGLSREAIISDAISNHRDDTQLQLISGTMHHPAFHPNRRHALDDKEQFGVLRRPFEKYTNCCLIAKKKEVCK